MTSLELARLQFGVTTIFHFFFVPVTIGMAVFVAVCQTLHYRTGTSDRAVAEGFLQRCAFDDAVSLEQMEASEALGAYLAGCRGPDGAYDFQHEAHLITWQQP